MARVYTMKFENVTATAAQDLLAIYTGSSKAIIVHEVVVGQVGVNTAAGLALSMKILSGTLTNGSGGSTGTVVANNPNDTAATVTGRTNDTTQASATTSVVHRAEVMQVVNGYQYLPPREDRFVCPASCIFVVSLDTAPASMAISGTITFEEIP